MVIQKVVIHHVKLFLPLPARCLPYVREHRTQIWKSSLDNNIGLCRYAHTIARAILRQILGGTLIDYGFALGGDFWYIMINVPQCRFTIESIQEFCEELCEMVVRETEFIEVESIGGEPTRFQLPVSLSCLLKLKE